ncbi:hypothetical protein EX30DRAFT_317083 [Ascodesmis nigricans]|uniref:Transcription factor IIIC subunit 5 HTH domain-containing protein n=1 Tax=Ascodesmis nigricans TaxID=341454 RepID=A0A4S2N1Y1_9PEZI|nr:hypothetical protein EX30DRAFT_317083 [Ascodesmis nigricans]
MQSLGPSIAVRTNSNPSAAPPPAKSSLSLTPWTPVPDKRLITVEHPAIIRNVDRGMETVGGEKALKKLASTRGESGLQLRFRPDDLMRPTIPSRTVPTNNLLVRVRIPKKKNLSPVEAEKEKEKSLLQKLRESEGKHKLEVVGMIEQTVRFRDMANFQYNHRDNPHVQKMRDTIFKGNYEDISKFKVSSESGVSRVESVVPPFMSITPIPHAYYYRQNPAIKKTLINGKTKLMNYQAGPKTLTPMMQNTMEHVPAPPADLPAYESLDGPTKECVDLLRGLFNQRPIWTRRALYNNFPRQLQPMVRFSMVHVGYMWRAGPWRDTCVRYGIDPRSDPKYRFYQCICFQMDPNANLISQGGSKDSHIFDGKHIVKDGRCYQLCDIQDPVLRKLIETEHIRKACDVNHDGWYRTCTMKKIKAVMKTIIHHIHEGSNHEDPTYRDIMGTIESEDEETEYARREKERQERVARGHKRRGIVHAGRTGVYQIKTRVPPGRKKAQPKAGVKGKAQSPSAQAEEPAQGATEAAGPGAEADENDYETDEAEQEAEADREDEWGQELEVPSLPGMTQDRLEDIMTMDDDGMGFDDNEEFEILEGSEDEDEED